MHMLKWNVEINMRYRNGNNMKWNESKWQYIKMWTNVNNINEINTKIKMILQ